MVGIVEFIVFVAIEVDFILFVAIEVSVQIS